MVTLSYNIRPQGNQAFDTQTRCLLLEAGHNYLTILLWDKIAGRPDSIEHFTGISHWGEDWEQMLQQSALLNYRNIEATALLNTFRCMPMPQVFFNPEEAKNQLAVLFGEKENIHSGAEVLENHDMVVCWEADLEVYTCLTNHFEVIRLQSLAAAMVQTGWKNGATGPHGKLLVSEDNAIVTAFRGNQFLILKVLRQDNAENMAYQMLNICKQWGIENNQMAWEVSGMLTTDAPMWQLPDRFFENFAPINPGMVLSPEIPGHFFAHLIQFMQGSKS